MNFNWNPETKHLYITIRRGAGAFSTKKIDEITELDYSGMNVVGINISDVSKKWKPNPLVVKEVGHFRTDLIEDYVKKMVENRIAVT